MKTLYIITFLLYLPSVLWADQTYLHFPSKEGSKHIVFLSGDEEYRSEEGLPMLAQMMNHHHGFECSVLFSLDEKGYVNPDNKKSLSNPEVLDQADMIVMLLRFRSWPDAAMKKFEAAYLRGVPIIALRTSSHAFKHKKGNPWFKYSSTSKIKGWERGFGQKVLGEWWGYHHGKHKEEGCRSVLKDTQKEHPILRGHQEFFCLADVYKAEPPEDATILLYGAVTESLDPKSANLKTNGLRRLIANSVFWGFEMDIPKETNVQIPSSYKPSMYGFKTFKKGMKPVDFIPSKE